MSFKKMFRPIVILSSSLCLTMETIGTWWYVIKINSMSSTHTRF